MALEPEGAEKPMTTPAIDRYFALEADLNAVYYNCLRPIELEKIRRALQALGAWLEER